MKVCRYLILAENEDRLDRIDQRASNWTTSRQDDHPILVSMREERGEEC